MDTMLTTSQAAARLGCTRQHVVDLCDRGDLPCTMVGTHRRIRERDLPHRLTEDQRRSLWLHHAVAGALVADPERLMAVARGAVQRSLDQSNDRARPWHERWKAILDQGVEATIETLTSPTQHASDMRQSSPFAGALEPSVRERVLRSWIEHRDAT